MYGRGNSRDAVQQPNLYAPKTHLTVTAEQVQDGAVAESQPRQPYPVRCLDVRDAQNHPMVFQHRYAADALRYCLREYWDVGTLGLLDPPVEQSGAAAEIIRDVIAVPPPMPHDVAKVGQEERAPIPIMIALNVRRHPNAGLIRLKREPAALDRKFAETVTITSSGHMQIDVTVGVYASGIERGHGVGEQIKELGQVLPSDAFVVHGRLPS